MADLEFLVLYQSATGNTEKVATAIFSALPGTNKDLLQIDLSRPIPKARTYFIGFPVNALQAPMEVADTISEIHDSRVALFATCGAPITEKYRKLIESSVMVWLDDDNDYLGFFMAQGKQPMIPPERIQGMIQYFSELYGLSEAEAQKQIINSHFESLLHPTPEDLQLAADFALKNAGSRLLEARNEDRYTYRMN